MNSEDYWRLRAAKRMYDAMESAEKTAAKIARLYMRCSGYILRKLDAIFDTFEKQHELTTEEAQLLISQVDDKTSLEELIQLFQTEPSNVGAALGVEAAAYAARMRRLSELQKEIDTVMHNVYKQETRIQDEFYATLAEECYYKTLYDTQQRAGIGFKFAHIDRKQIDKVLNMNWSGKHYSKRIWNNTEALADRAQQEILTALLTGKTEQEAAGDISQTFAAGAAQSRRLIRTESNHVTTEINFQAYQEADVQKYQFLATLDLKTSSICRSLDGKIYSISERQPGTNCPPMHPWCRSTTISVIDRKALEGMTRTARDPKTGKNRKVPGTMTYTEWYNMYVKGDVTAERNEKMIKSKSADRRQFSRYREAIGDDMPKSFADFQNLKYNEPEKWKKLQQKYQDIRLQEKIRSKDYPKRIEEGKQGKHIVGHNNYIEGRSYLTIDAKEVQDLVNKYAGTGKIQRDRQGHWNHKEVVTMRKNIGVYKDLKGNEFPTDIATIHYSKNGVHVVPAKPKEG